MTPITRERAVRILTRHWKIQKQNAKVFGCRLNGVCVLSVHEVPETPGTCGRVFRVARGKSWLEALRKWVPQRVIDES